MKFLGIAIAFGILLIPGTARAEWIYAASSEQADTYLDDSSINQQGDVVKYWSMDIFRKPLKGKVKRMIYQKAANCSSNTSSTTNSVFFASNGKQIGNSSYNDAPSSVVPGTVGYIIQQTVCGN
jgi:hypothetical protein